MIDLKNFKRLEYMGADGKLRCGLTDRFVSGEDALFETGRIAKQLLTDGTAGVCYYEDCADQAEKVCRLLEHEGFSVERVRFAANTPANAENAQDIVDCKERIRLLVGVGGGSLCDMLKYAAKRRGNPLLFVVTSPGTDGYLTDKAYFCEQFPEVHECSAPSAVILDAKMMENCPTRLIAAGYGEIMSKSLELFETAFCATMRSAPILNSAAEEKKRILTDFYNKFAHTENTAYLIAETLAKWGLIRQTERESEPPIFAHETVAFFYRSAKKEEAPLGIDKGLACLALATFYACALEESAYLPRIPHAQADGLVRLCKLLGCDAVEQTMKLDTREFPVKKLYVYEEYRPDFSRMITRIRDKTRVCFRSFRRLFSDAGYWLEQYTDADLLGDCIVWGAAAADRNSFLYLLGKSA